MFSFRQSQLALLAVVALGALLARPSGVLARQTTIQIRSDVATSVVFDSCGPTVTESAQTSTHVSIEVNGTDQYGAPVFLHRTLRVDLEGTWTANGKSLVFAANVVVESPQIVANGPITVTLPDGTTRAGSSYSVDGEAVNGVQLRIKLPNARLVFIDAGRVSYNVSFVLFNDFSFMTLSQDNFALSGQHPLTERGRDCPTIQQYLG